MSQYGPNLIIEDDGKVGSAPIYLNSHQNVRGNNIRK
jgi:hypothetical protein